MGAGNSIINRWEEAISTMPLIAILRGVRPAEVIVIADALIQAGIGVVEVPLNSPSPFESIKLLTQAHGDHIIVGAGTVLNLKDVDALRGCKPKPPKIPSSLLGGIFHGHSLSHVADFAWIPRLLI